MNDRSSPKEFNTQYDDTTRTVAMKVIIDMSCPLSQAIEK
jgi:hypothetical protein